MNINITIPDASSNSIVDGVAQATGWTTESGKTKAAWTRDKTASWLKETAKRGLLRKSQTNINAEIDAIVFS